MRCFSANRFQTRIFRRQPTLIYTRRMPFRRLFCSDDGTVSSDWEDIKPESEEEEYEMKTNTRSSAPELMQILEERGMVLASSRWERLAEHLKKPRVRLFL